MPKLKPQVWFWLTAAFLVSGLTTYWAVPLAVVDQVKPAEVLATPSRIVRRPEVFVPGTPFFPSQRPAPYPRRSSAIVNAAASTLIDGNEERVPGVINASPVLVPATFETVQPAHIPDAVWLPGTIESAD